MLGFSQHMGWGISWKKPLKPSPKMLAEHRHLARLAVLDPICRMSTQKVIANFSFLFRMDLNCSLESTWTEATAGQSANHRESITFCQKSCRGTCTIST